MTETSFFYARLSTLHATQRLTLATTEDRRTPNESALFVSLDVERASERLHRLTWTTGFSPATPTHDGSVLTLV